MKEGHLEPTISCELISIHSISMCYILTTSTRKATFKSPCRPPNSVNRFLFFFDHWFHLQKKKRDDRSQNVLIAFRCIDVIVKNYSLYTFRGSRRSSCYTGSYNKWSFQTAIRSMEFIFYYCKSKLFLLP